MCSGAGAVWVWDKSKAQVRTSQLHASSTYVVLTHGDGHADIQASPGSCPCLMQKQAGPLQSCICSAGCQAMSSSQASWR